MEKIKLANIVGARPQFIKAAMLSKAVRRNDRFEEWIIHSGQHYDNNMSSIFFEEMEIPLPDLVLNISGGSHGKMTGEMLIRFEEVFHDNQPDYVLVYGDTNTSLAAAMAAKKMHITVVHIEAGVRNYDERMPEEVNRYLIDRMSDINFCCTYLGEENLRSEGYGSKSINSFVWNCGDLMYDAAIHYSKRIGDSKVLSENGISEDGFVLCTIHRASNTDDPNHLHAILDALEVIALETTVVFPIHPRTRSAMGNRKLGHGILLLEPLGYFEMLALLSRCSYVLTDSGGVVREAYFFQKPSLLILKQPLWPELVDVGVCINTEPNMDAILRASGTMSSVKVSATPGIFGNGHAADCILNHLLSYHQSH